jgi:hypothetical protein
MLIWTLASRGIARDSRGGAPGRAAMPDELAQSGDRVIAISLVRRGAVSQTKAIASLMLAFRARQGSRRCARSRLLTAVNSLRLEVPGLEFRRL